MAVAVGFDRDRFIADIAQALQALPASPDFPDAARFAARFFEHTTATDAKLHETTVWAALLSDLLGFASRREPGTARIRVLNPDHRGHGGPGTNTLVQVITDDSPFLVDSVNLAISARGLDVQALIHPVVSLVRDTQGQLSAIDDERGEAESILHFEIDRIVDAVARDELEEHIRQLLAEVRVVVRDWQSMRDRMRETADHFPEHRLIVDEAGLNEVREFLRWVADDHFTYLGYREYEVAERNGEEVLRAVPDTGLGILSGTPRDPHSLRTVAAAQLHKPSATDTIILTKTNSLSNVHRSGYMDYIGVLRFDQAGKPVYEQRFLGHFTASAYMSRPQDIPLLSHKCYNVMARSGLRTDSYSGKALRHILETLPRDELLQSSEDELYQLASAVIDLRERPRTRLFVRADKYARFVSCLVFVPRDRFSAGARHRIEAALKDAFRGVHMDSRVLMAESALARLHVTIRFSPERRPEVDQTDLEARLVRAVRDWRDDLLTCLSEDVGQTRGRALTNRFGLALPAAYREQVPPIVAARDVQVLEALEQDHRPRLSLHHSADGNSLRFKIYRSGADLALSDVLPQLEHLGMRVITERVYHVNDDESSLSIQDFQVEPMAALAFEVSAISYSFEQAFEQVWLGDSESDNFNRLVLGASLDWRQVAMLRAYCKYLQQVGMAFSQSYVEETLNRYPAIAALLVKLFEARFDPTIDQPRTERRAQCSQHLRATLQALAPGAALEQGAPLADHLASTLGKPRHEQIDAFRHAINVLLDGVASLDDERIIKSYVGVIDATLRTGFYQTFNDAPRHCISFKLDPAQVPDVPKPIPYREIWVCGPRVEGVHLRFGRVARGGLRWSDRREDFRTEVLGLVKAQMVKNTVIVPVGSKGGFFVKRPADPTDRDAMLEEGKACYRMFIKGMLDLTDNLAGDQVIAPDDVVRHDNDDPYLVVAADKGTAKFSDMANEIATEHEYWLGDAFASGGSHGYDHKGMGITAKGAWESVKRHFRSLEHDCQKNEFTCVGIGDMSGDVFGNGMLRSEHLRLIGAFNHLHIFVDPSPDATIGFAERQRLFDLPRSSWDDYDRTLLSEGGGIWPRSVKSIPVSKPMREALGLAADIQQMTPNELISALLCAPVDLLWNGGIGTYVKAAKETHDDVGDRHNNAIRINGGQLRCRIVGEGGNLGFTQKGRVEAACNGVLLNTDFIDNSAGVDTSDHEVNIKILLNDAVQHGELDFEARNRQLAVMSDEVESLVLADNYRQNQAISLLERMAVRRLGSMAHFIRTLEDEGHLDREVESLPGDEEIGERMARGQGLTRPELAILLSYDKIQLFEQLLDSDIPEDSYLSRELGNYFPEPLRGPYAEHMQRHRLKREIIASAVTNSIVNRMGATFMLRMQEDTGQRPAAIARAFTAACQILDAPSLWEDIEALDACVAEAAQLDALVQTWRLLRQMTRWLLLSQPGRGPDIAATIERYHPVITTLRESVFDALTPNGRQDFHQRQLGWCKHDFPDQLAERLARSPLLRAALDMAEVSHQSRQSVVHVASVFFNLAEDLDLARLRSDVEALPVKMRWHAQARSALMDELNHQHCHLAARVLAWSSDHHHNDPVAAWLEQGNGTLQYARTVLAEIMAQPVDYPTASVAIQRLAQLAQAIR